MTILRESRRRRSCLHGIRKLGVDPDALEDTEQENAEANRDVHTVRAHARGLENASFKIRLMRPS